MSSWSTVCNSIRNWFHIRGKSSTSKMNFNFSVNETFPADCGEVTSSGLHRTVVKVTSDLLPVGYAGHIKSMQEVQSRVSAILDAMGQASALAQDLRQAITSGSKLRMQDEHTVYFLIDRTGNHGAGTVLGLLKVGKKNLFLVDSYGSQKQARILQLLSIFCKVPYNY